MSDTVMFCFGGRRENLELQLPHVARILHENPQVEYHLWNLARTKEDANYIASLEEKGMKGLYVINDFYGADPWTRFNDVYRHYAKPGYTGCKFVKLDDDVVFIETERFGQFVDHIDDASFLSANVVNNGACTATIEAMPAKFRRLNIPLLDVHKSFKYARASHDHFIENWEHLIAAPVNFVDTKDWLSINLIGYGYHLGVQLANLLDAPHPRRVAGRQFKPNAKVGDEGGVNTFPRQIMQGFMAAHLTFGPQTRLQPDVPTSPWDSYRAAYQGIGHDYRKRLDVLSDTSRWTVKG